MQVNTTAVISALVGIVTLGGAAFKIDATYQHRTEALEQSAAARAYADSQFALQAKDDERAMLETRQELTQLKLKLLLGKASPSPEELAEIDYLKGVLLEIRKRLDQLNGK